MYTILALEISWPADSHSPGMISEKSQIADLCCWLSYKQEELRKWAADKVRKDILWENGVLSLNYLKATSHLSQLFTYVWNITYDTKEQSKYLFYYLCV